MNQYKFGECPICRQGRLLAVRGAAHDRLLVMCDDCESQWESPQEAKFFDHALTVEIKGVIDATAEQVETAGWAPYALS